MTSPSTLDRTLLALILVFAILPLGLIQLFAQNRWPLVGGIFLNPMCLCAYAWLTLTCIYYQRKRTRAAAGLFLLFPVAFAVPWFFWSLHWALATHHFGH